MTTNNELSRTEVANRLRREAVGVKLERSQFGVSRRLDNSQKGQIAGLFGADAERLSAGKKLLNKKHEAYANLTSLLGQAREIWVDSTLPFPEPGIRLIRRDKVSEFDERMVALRADVRDAARKLEEVYHEELIPDARKRLGDLFNEGDYPTHIQDEFDLEVSYPNVEPGEYLRQISPKLYEQEQQRIQARFEEAIALAEQNFAAEFAQIIEHLLERLTPSADGKQKVFRDSALENIGDFFKKFKSLDVGSSPELSGLIEQAEAAVAGVNPVSLRKDATNREAIRESLASLSQRVEGLLIDKPKRKITFEDEAA